MWVIYNPSLRVYKTLRGFGTLDEALLFQLDYQAENYLRKMKKAAKLVVAFRHI